jgi:3-oxoacid CoA-transferase subunit A
MLIRNLARNVYYFQKINKVVGSLQEALEGITDGSKILVGGFGICGVPMNLIQGVK